MRLLGVREMMRCAAGRAAAAFARIPSSRGFLAHFGRIFGNPEFSWLI